VKIYFSVLPESYEKPALNFAKRSRTAFPDIQSQLPTGITGRIVVDFYIDETGAVRPASARR